MGVGGRITLKDHMLPHETFPNNLIAKIFNRSVFLGNQSQAGFKYADPIPKSGAIN